MLFGPMIRPVSMASFSVAASAGSLSPYRLCSRPGRSASAGLRLDGAQPSTGAGPRMISGVTPPTPKPLSVCPVAFCAPGRASSARLSQPDSVWPGAVMPDSSTS